PGDRGLGVGHVDGNLGQQLRLRRRDLQGAPRRRRSPPGCLHHRLMALPALPQVFIDTTIVPPTGATIVVGAGGNLQAALNAANLGDVITLQAGATFTGPFTLPNKTTGTGWITVRTSALGSLPAPGNRVRPSDG